MASQAVTIYAAGVEAAPFGYTVPNAQEITPLAANATFDGTGAIVPFVPTLEIVNDAGIVIARVPVSTTVAAGGSAEVTFAPFLRSGVAGGLVPPPGPVVGFDAYAVYTGGESGVFTVPSNAKLLQVVCVGAGGGGGAGQRSGANATLGVGGGGGGGGATSIAWWDCERLNALYPSGVTYSVGTGGGGGVTTGANGANGSGPTFFGEQQAGCGGGGTGGIANNSSNHAGSGGGITDASLQNSGSPSSTSSIPMNGILASTERGPGTGPPSTEYGGAAGGTHPASPAIGGNFPGQQGGSSLWGGAGGGGGGCWTNLGTQQGGTGGIAGSYPATNTNAGNGTNMAGTFTGAWTGSGGDGGTAQVGAGGNATKGYDGSVGAGGGGGGGSGLGTAGIGGTGGDGLIVIYAFG